ncbi:MAG: HlyD family type I secretion periplasmic adaptor subunit, partial [Alphaproteobacteria bacterium]|nr:HlyD family type I secretion periplasmic adaptor subunit [Alphaproteobacteria bacterium]
GWAALAHVDGAVVAAGQVTVESNRKSVQHFEGGIVRDILVVEGDAVHAGDTLVLLDDTTARAEFALLDAQICEALARLARLMAERDRSGTVTFPDELLKRVHDQKVDDLMKGQLAMFDARRARFETEVDLLRERRTQLQDEIGGLESQRKAVQRQIDIIVRELRTAKTLLAKKLTSAVRVNRLSRDVEEKRGEAAELSADIASTTGRASETELEIVRLERGFQEEVAAELRTVGAELNTLTERRIAANDRLRRTQITAPRQGVVLNLQVHNVGHVIAPGEKIMEIVPANDQLVVKAQIRPEDIDRVVAGASAELVLSAFNRRTTPRLYSRVVRVSPDQIEGRTGEPPHYAAILKISKEQAVRLGDLELLPGMPVEVYIRTGQRAVLSFILKPLTDYLKRAFREE